MTRRFVFAVLALALVVAPLGACNDNKDDRREGADENVAQPPADTAKAPS